MIVSVIAIFLLLTAGPVHAGDPLATVKGMEIVKGFMASGQEIKEARDLGSLYEIVALDPRSGKQVIYVTRDGSYLILGANVIDKNRVNLTRERYEEINKVDISKLPLDDAILIKKGNGSKKLIMITDVDCPFCRKAYEWIKTQDNYALYVFLFPLNMHPKAREKSIKVLCSENRAAALDQAQSENEMPGSTCDAGEKLLEKDMGVLNGLSITGTPVFITDSGSRITGFNKPALEAYLNK